MSWDVVVTCGGTGGHVLPALAVVDALIEAGVRRDRIAFFGGARGQETTLVPAAGIAFEAFEVRGLQRSFSPRGMAGAVGAVVALVRARRRARGLLRGGGARVVVGMGGYASLPATIGAPPGVHVVLYESNSIPGLAVKAAARRATFIGTAFVHTTTLLRRAERVGFVVRKALSGFDRSALQPGARADYGIGPGRRTIAVMGGSQGARSLNYGVADLVRRWRDRDDVAIVHLIGRRDHAELKSSLETRGEGAITYVPLAYEDRMERVYAVADLLVCRSGASTCAELAVTGTPAICVPYAHATEDHQTWNARELVAAGAADLLPDAAVTGAGLAERIDTLLADPVTLGGMRAAATGLGARDGAAALAARVTGLLGSAEAA